MYSRSSLLADGSAPIAIELAGTRLELLRERAVWLPEQRTLLVADVHIGKAASFRRWGVPVPRGTTTDSLDRLSALVREHGAEQVIVLGDFLHSARAHSPSTLGALARWHDEHRALAMTLVRGNHDARAGDPPVSLGIEVVDEPLCLDGLALCHHPRPVAGAYVLAGHWHPCTSVGGRAGDRLRLPCFWFGDAADGPERAVGILPAFGAFTGMHPIDAAGNDRVWLVGEDRLVELPRRAPAPHPAS
jgi:DNA ligase-associated metallophosphoesterase